MGKEDRADLADLLKEEQPMLEEITVMETRTYRKRFIRGRLPFPSRMIVCKFLIYNKILSVSREKPSRRIGQHKTWGQISCHMRRYRKRSVPCLGRFYGFLWQLLIQHPGYRFANNLFFRYTDIMNTVQEKKQKKYPCPECEFCQWCSCDRCSLCRGSCAKKSKKKKKKEHRPLFRSY